MTTLCSYFRLPLLAQARNAGRCGTVLGEREGRSVDRKPGGIDLGKWNRENPQVAAA